MRPGMRSRAIAFSVTSVIGGALLGLAFGGRRDSIVVATIVLFLWLVAYGAAKLLVAANSEADGFRLSVSRRAGRRISLVMFLVALPSAFLAWSQGGLKIAIILGLVTVATALNLWWVTKRE